MMRDSMGRIATGVVIAAGGLMAAACDVPTLPPPAANDVFDFRLQTTPPSVLRWPSGSDVRVYVAGGTAAREAVLAAAFNHGAAAWNRSSRFGEYRLVRATSLTAADAVLRWSDETAPVDTDECPPTIVSAVTTFCLTDPDPAVARLLAFPLRPPHQDANSSVRMLVTILGAHAVDPERVTRLVAHELGHVLGIAGHSPQPQDLMYGGEPPRADPGRRDAATMHVLYHTQADIHP